MNSKFLFELGTEEIPAWMIVPAERQLKVSVENLLRDNQLTWGRLVLYNTPRRLTIIGEGLPSKQPDRQELISGPPKSAAFDEANQPTKAAEGFARKLGVTVEELEIVESAKGEYLALKRQIPGKDVPDILKEGLPGVIASISWPKNMYWRESRFRYIRPLRWFLALWKEDVIDFEFEGVRSGRTSRGHRSLGSTRVEISDVDSYVDSLRREYVLVDPSERRDRIVSGIQQEADGMELLEDQELLETVVHLNEYPTVLRGSFDASYLSIPREVLTTVMRHHQKYFSLLKADGSLAPGFLTVLNTAGDPTGKIRQGHERVLQARLEDASFFWKTDRQKTLRERAELLDHVLFQEQLGTYLDKTKRLRRICSKLKQDPDLDRAAQLCKADLTTEMVRELPELQGIMGGLYARSEGLGESIWKAIYEHYQPVVFEDDIPTTETGVLLSIADRLDTIVGCFGIGIVPTGSRDPFALRRQAQGLVSILNRRRLGFSLRELVEIAQDTFEPSEEIRKEVERFLQRRVRFLLQKQGVSYDILNALFSVGMGTVHSAGDRAKALESIRGEADFEALATAYKRIKNILIKQGGEVSPLNPDLLVEPEEKELYSAYERLQPTVVECIEAEDYLEALRAMAAVREVVDRFFDKVLVMVEEAEVRCNRLALLNAVSDVFLLVADISEIVQEGEENG